MSMQTTTGQKRNTAPEPPGAALATIGESAIQSSGETAALAAAERSRAIVQSKIMQALARPRKMSVVRERILEDCDRPAFAKVSRYARPQGQKKIENPDGTEEWVPNIIEGWSIRFVEAAVQALGNVDPGTSILYEDERKKIVRCEVWDYERNIAWSKEVTIEKTIERSKLRKGQVPLYQRKNSYGENVYILPATDEEVRLKENRLVSMELRTLGLRVIPGDILDEAKERVEATREKALAAEKAGIVADPTKARKELLDRLAKIGIRANDVIDYLGGRSIEEATPDQILELRIIGAGVNSGDLSWRDALEGSPYRQAPATAEGAPEESAGAKAAREKIEAQMRKTKEKKAQAEAGAGKTPPQGTPAATSTPAPEPPKEPATPPPPPAEPTERQPGEDG